jgi:hypothetical protein
VTPASSAEAAVREAARSAFDEAASEERELGPASPATYPAPVAEIAVPPLPPGPVRSSLPGRGKRGPGCGAKLPLGWLAGDGCLPLTIHECERRDCPRFGRPHKAEECEFGVPHGGGDWAHGAALEVAVKVQGYAGTQGLDRLRQVVISPPIERYDEADGHDRIIERVRRASAKALRELAWDGQYWASLVVHLYRGCEREGYDEWGPHAHAVGPGVDVRRTEEYWLRTGGSYWMNPEVPEELVLDSEGKPLVRTQGVVVKQPNRKDGAFASYWGRSLVRHLVYELGHAAIVPNGHAVSYVGKGLIAFAPPTPEPEPGPTEESRPKCPHGLEFSALGDGGRWRYDPESREWTLPADRDRFYRFLDQAPAQGGPLLELVGPSGRPRSVAVTSYLDQRGLPEPRRVWAGRKRPPSSSAVPWDPPSDWRPEES